MNITCPTCGERPWDEFEHLGNIESFRHKISEGDEGVHGREVMRHKDCGTLIGHLWTRTTSFDRYDSYVSEGPDEYLGEYVHCGNKGYLYRVKGKLTWKDVASAFDIGAKYQLEHNIRQAKINDENPA